MKLQARVRHHFDRCVLYGGARSDADGAMTRQEEEDRSCEFECVREHHLFDDLFAI